jgi:Flp pilus assembly pilin Flp
VVSGLILAFGIIAALDQLHVATNVVNAVLYAALAALVGVVVVAVGGGGIRTMSRRWEAVADRYDEEKPKIVESARNAPSVKDQARQARDAVGSQYGNGTQSPDGERYGASRL